MMSGGFPNIVVALIVLGIIIVIHELGHFLVAKFFKIRVETFSVGFGPRLIGFRRGETDYRISAFPLGGYVKMSGENPTDSVTGAPHEFLSKPKWQRFLVAAAGPAMNVVLAVALLTGLYMYGTEVAASAEGFAVVGTVDPGSPAEAAGVQPGDRVSSVNGKTDPNWEELEARILTNPGVPVDLVLERGERKIEVTVTPIRKGPNDTGYAGFEPIIVTNVIESVRPGSPADGAGIKPGDAIAAVGGVEAKDSGTVVKRAIQEDTSETLTLKIRRDGNEMELQVKPTFEENERRIGVSFLSPTVMIQESFGGAVTRAIDKNIEYGTLIFHVLGRLINRDLPMKAVDGPIGIVRIAGQFWEAGMAPLITLMAMISLNLGIMNLLPIPILDGGVMLLLLIESLMGRDLSMALKERIVQVSFVFLLTLMVFVLYNDVVKLFPTGQ
jgi:regulator of sigma E protease